MISKKNIIKLLQNNGIETTKKTLVELVIIAMDNNLLTREDIIKQSTEKKEKPLKETTKEPKKRGRKRKFPPKEEIDKVIDPKYYRLRTIKMQPVQIKVTNIENGEEIVYKSIYQAYIKTKHSFDYYKARDGKIIDGIRIDIIK